MVREVLDDFLHQPNGDAAPKRAATVAVDGQPVGEIRIGLGSCCVAQGSGKVREALDRRAGRDRRARPCVKRVGCVGMCHQTPLVEIVPPGGHVAALRPGAARGRRGRSCCGTSGRAGWCGGSAIARAGWLDRLLTDETSDPSVAARDRRRATGRSARSSARSGTWPPSTAASSTRPTWTSTCATTASRPCGSASSERSPEQIIDEIQASGLRGRGGAGFPDRR